MQIERKRRDNSTYGLTAVAQSATRLRRNDDYNSGFAPAVLVSFTTGSRWILAAKITTTAVLSPFPDQPIRMQRRGRVVQTQSVNSPPVSCIQRLNLNHDVSRQGAESISGLEIRDNSPSILTK